MAKNQSLSDKIEMFLHRWHRGALILRSLSFLLGIIAIAASLVIATFTTEIGAYWTKIIAIISAASFGILKSFQINEKANGFRQAYRHLYKAYYFEYLKPNDPSIDKLREAYEQAVEMIGAWSLNIDRPPDQAEKQGQPKTSSS